MKTNKFLTLSVIASFAFLASCGAQATQTTQTTVQTTQETQIVQAVSTGNITLNNESISITEAGEYTLSGNIADGQILVDAGEDAKVILNLAGVNITSSNSAAIYVKSGKATIHLVDGTTNVLTDGTTYTNQTDNEPNAAIFAKEDLKISGNGSLTVNANFNDGISTKDDLTIEGGNIIVNAVDDGIRGKDTLTIEGGNITVTVKTGDALKSDDETKGTITINNGTLTLASAESQGIKSYNSTTINGGKINITQSKEWMESEKIIINNGEIDIVSSDDGINVSSSDETTTSTHMGAATNTVNEDIKLTINGGKLTVNAEGDGLDANGSIEINGGTTVVYGPTRGGNGSLDYDATFVINGGELYSFGFGDMEQGITATSQQNAVLIGASGNAGSKITIKDSSGNIVAEHTSLKAFGSVTISVNSLKQGETYTYEIDGASSGSFTVSAVSNQAGNVRSGMGGRGGRMGGMPPSGARTMMNNNDNPPSMPPEFQQSN